MRAKLADDDAGREQCGAGCNTRRLAPRDAGLDERKQLVDHQRERCGGHAAEQHVDPALGLQAREDVIAEARLAHRRRERGGADHPDGGRPNARHEHRRGERKLHANEALPIRHADAARGLAKRRIEIQDAGHAVADHGKHRVERERQQRRQEPECREAYAEEPRRQRGEREQQRIEQREQREPGNRLYEAG